MANHPRSPTDAARVAAARLVAGPAGKGGALLISVRNDGLGWVEVADAVSTGLAYAVTPHPGLLCIDLDLDVPNPRRAAATFERLVSAASAAGVPHVVCGSGRDGHRHLFCSTGVLEGEVRDALDLRLRAAGLDVRRNAIRPPLAPHRTATSWSRPDRNLDTLSEPAVPDAVAAFLDTLGVNPEGVDRSPSDAPDTRHAAARDRSAAKRPTHEVLDRVSSRVAALLRYGHRRFKYRSASEARMAVAAEVARHGGDASHLDELLSDPRHLLGVSYRRRPRTWQTQECARLITKVNVGPSRNLAIAAWSAAVGAARWTGQAGHTDLAVAELLAARALRCGSDTVALATAEIAAEIGVGPSTARRALRRLRDAGWLNVAERHTPTLATLHQLTIPSGTQVCAAAGDHIGDELGCDAARRGGLGRVAVRIWRLLAQSRSAAHLAAYLGVGAATVHAHIRRLRRHGCVRRDAAGWVACGDLERAARVTGVAGARVTARTELAVRRTRRHQQLRALLRDRGGLRCGRAATHSDHAP